MSWANQLNLTNVELGLMLVGGAVLFGFLALFLYLRRTLPKGLQKKPPALDSARLGEWVRESDAICQNLSKNLEEKRAIADRLIAQLDQRIRSLQVLGNGSSRPETLPAKESRNEVDEDVCALSKAGYDVPEIARSLGLPKGQVELILDLKRYCQ
jgi:hypothetical protein